MAADIGAFEPGHGLLEALLGVTVARIVAGMLAADARHLLLQHGESLEFGFRHFGQVIGAFLQLAVEARQRAEAIDQVGELRGNLVLAGFPAEGRRRA